MLPDVNEKYSITLYHHNLWWRVFCAECTSTEFQRYFEMIAEQVWPGFTKVKPWGKVGDQKCDGGGC